MIEVAGLYFAWGWLVLTFFWGLIVGLLFAYGLGHHHHAGVSWE
jgi:hypothetical protein